METKLLQFSPQQKKLKSPSFKGRHAYDHNLAVGWVIKNNTIISIVLIPVFSFHSDITFCERVWIYYTIKWAVFIKLWTIDITL